MTDWIIAICSTISVALSIAAVVKARAAASKIVLLNQRIANIEQVFSIGLMFGRGGDGGDGGDAIGPNSVGGGGGGGGGVGIRISSKSEQ